MTSTADAGGKNAKSYICAVQNVDARQLFFILYFALMNAEFDPPKFEEHPVQGDKFFMYARFKDAKLSVL